MKVERTFNGHDSFLGLLMPLIYATEIDRIMEQQNNLLTV